MSTRRNRASAARSINSAPPIHLLVADDHPILRKGLQDLFSSSDDFKIIGEAADGKQACELTQQLQPDVVLMDINMPKMNGIDATRWIKTRLPHVTVVGLSINDNVTVANRMKAAGAAAYLTKETPLEDFCRAIRSALTH